MIGVAVALSRAVQRADEYGRIVMLECMALGFGVGHVVRLNQVAQLASLMHARRPRTLYGSALQSGSVGQHSST